MSEAICLGIDLGTTNSCLACYYKGEPPRNPMVIENEDSQFTTPSVVSFDDDQVLIGKHALKKRPENPSNTLYCVKRLIGRKFSDPCVQKDKLNYTYRIKRGENDLPMLAINTKRYKDVQLQPEQVSSMVLAYLKKCADQKCLKSTKNVVITVPANFNDYQRRATMDAAKIADFEPVCVISEPTAACIAHAYNTGFNPETIHVLVYDYGGGTLDVSLVKIQGGTITVVATAGNAHCGGEDIDIEIYNKCKHKLEDDFNIHLDDIELDTATSEKNKRIKAQLLALCEEAKRNLSTTENTEIILPDIDGSQTFRMPMTQSDIDQIIISKQKLLIDPIEKVLTTAKMTPTDIKDIILVGGSSRIPKVKKLIEEKMSKTTFSPANPDEAIALGASIYGAFKLGTKIKDFPTFTITDVTPMSIGFGTRNGQITEAIPRNTPRPARSEPRAFRPSNPETRTVTLSVYEGDSKLTKECYKVANFEIELPPPKEGEVCRIFQRIDVTDTEITVYAIISETPPDIQNGDPNEKKLIIKNDKPAHTRDDINRMKQDNLKMLEAQQQESDINYLAIAIQNCNSVKTAKTQMTKDKAIRTQIDQIVAETKKEIHDEFNDDHKMTLDDFNDKMIAFEDRITAIFPGYKRPQKFQTF